MSKAEEKLIDDCWNRIGVWRSGNERCEKLDRVIHCYNCEVYADVGHSLLDRQSPEGYSQEWTRFLAQEVSDNRTDLNSVLVFRLGAEWLGLPVSLINEITLMRGIFDLPHNNNRIIRGLVNIRGILTVCISLGSLLGVDKPDEDWEEDENSIQRLIILNMKSGDVVFPVSEIHSITRFSNDELGPAPLSSKNSDSGFVHGMLEWNNKHVGCLDKDKIIDALNRTFQ